MQTLLLTSLLSFLGSIAITFLAEHLTQPVQIIGSFATLSLSHNSGIAFGIPLPETGKELLIGAALILVIIVAVRSIRATQSTPSGGTTPLPPGEGKGVREITPLSFGLIIGGALANLIDRIPDGLVTDYFAIGTFPVFNAADSCISIGVGLLLFDMYLRKTPQGAKNC